MERRPEPELMDEDAQARAYSEADFSEPHQAFVDTFRARFSGRDVEGRVLDLGCGPADVTVRFAAAFPRCHIDGVDGAAAMLALGRARIEAAGLADRVALYRAHLPDDAPPHERYDVVISNSLLHHLAHSATLWRSIQRFGAPGAAVFVMDLMRPADEASALALVEAHTQGAPEVLRHDFHASLHAAYTEEEVREQLEQHGLSQLTVEAVTDRHLIVYGTL